MDTALFAWEIWRNLGESKQCFSAGNSKFRMKNWPAELPRRQVHVLWDGVLWIPFGVGKSALHTWLWFVFSLASFVLRLTRCWRRRPGKPGGTQEAGGAVQEAVVACFFFSFFVLHLPDWRRLHNSRRWFLKQGRGRFALFPKPRGRYWAWASEAANSSRASKSARLALHCCRKKKYKNCTYYKG